MTPSIWQTTVRLAIKCPRDRTIRSHLTTVWANFGDKFMTRRAFLLEVAKASEGETKAIAEIMAEETE